MKKSSHKWTGRYKHTNKQLTERKGIQPPPSNKIITSQKNHVEVLQREWSEKKPNTRQRKSHIIVLFLIKVSPLDQQDIHEHPQNKCPPFPKSEKWMALPSTPGVTLEFKIRSQSHPPLLKSTNTPQIHPNAKTPFFDSPFSLPASSLFPHPKTPQTHLISAQLLHRFPLNGESSLGALCFSRGRELRGNSVLLPLAPGVSQNCIVRGEAQQYRIHPLSACHSG